MFILWQNYEGLQITILSLKEIFKSLLEHHVPYSLLERFCRENCNIHLDQLLQMLR